MFCSTCGCDLPAVARFCVKCGSRVGSAPPSPQAPPLSTGKLYCVSCGHAYESSHRFCNFCGHALGARAISDAPVESPTIEQPPTLLASAEETVNQPRESTGVAALEPEAKEPLAREVPSFAAPDPPYAKFVTLSISSGLAASITSFIIADGYARQQWNSMPLAIAATVVCLLFLNFAIKTAGRLRQIGTSDILLKRKKLIYRNVFFAALFIGTAALIGSGIGASGAETGHLLSDIQEMSRIGDRISKARTAAARTVPAQVEMYKSIEPDVEQLSATLGRLQPEWAIYDGKFPAQHETTEKAIQSAQTGAKRMDLLRQQIAVAKLIEGLDSNAQLGAWERQMQPLLDREDQLDSTK